MNRQEPSENKVSLVFVYLFGFCLVFVWFLGFCSVVWVIFLLCFCEGFSRVISPKTHRILDGIRGPFSCNLPWCYFFHRILYGGFLKLWYPNNQGFPTITKNDDFGVWNAGTTIFSETPVAWCQMGEAEIWSASLEFICSPIKLMVNWASLGPVFWIPIGSPFLEGLGYYLGPEIPRNQSKAPGQKKTPFCYILLDIWHLCHGGETFDLSHKSFERTSQNEQTAKHLGQQKGGGFSVSQYMWISNYLTAKGSWGRDIPLFQWNLGWWNIIFWPDWLILEEDMWQGGHGGSKNLDFFL